MAGSNKIQNTIQKEELKKVNKYCTCLCLFIYLFFVFASYTFFCAD